MLTEQQKHEFNTFGFLLLKDFIPPDEMKAYVDAFDETMIRANGGVPWQEAPQTHAVMPFYRHNTAVYHRLLDHDGINEAVEELLGEDYMFWLSEGHRRWNGLGWHHDAVAPDGLTHLKVVLYIDPVRADTGCLTLLPGSQHAPLRERMERWYGGPVLGDDSVWSAAVPIESDPGDAVIFNVNAYHAVIGEDLDRRAIFINYMQKLSTPEQKEYLTSLYNFDSPYYTSELFEDATPKRMRMLSFMKEAFYDAN